jgi:hypothetical protein
MIMCGPVSSNKVKWTGTWSKVAKKTCIYLDVSFMNRKLAFPAVDLLLYICIQKAGQL